MSLYANINISKAQAEANAVKKPASKASKSAVLYAGVLAKPPPQSPQNVPPSRQLPTAQVPEVVQVDTEKSSEASGPPHGKAYTYVVALQFKPTIRKIQKPVKAKGFTPVTTDAPVAPVLSSNSFLQDVARIQEDIANDDVNGYYRTMEGQKLARRNNRKKKRKNNDGQGTYVWTWDDDYDPLHPNDYETYIDSDEQLREQIEWQRKLDGKDPYEEEVEEEEDSGYRGFAPPEEYEEERDWEMPQDDSEYIPEPAVAIAMDESADDVFARRMRMAQEAGIKIRPPTPPTMAKVEEEEADGEQMKGSDEDISSVEGAESKPIRISPSPPPAQSTPIPPPQTISEPTFEYNPFYDQPPSLYASAPGMQPTPPIRSSIISSEPVYYAAATMSSEPVHYDARLSQSNTPAEDEPRSSLPGQKGFAKRLMSKYGWEKGQALGNTQAGLVTPLIAKADKDRKGTGVILNRNKVVEDYGPFGKMTRCIVLFNVVGLGEVDEELVDEIGGECRQKYGEVERIRVVENPKARNEEEMVRVFVLFTSELSALRGVNALDGRLFGGRKIKARFYDADKFEAGDFRL